MVINKAIRYKNSRWFEFLQEARESGDFESYVEEHADELSETENLWRFVCFSKLTEPFIQRNWTKVDWPMVCEFSELTDDFMRKFICFIDLEKVSKYQLLSDDFVYQYRYSLDWSSLLFHQTFSESLLLELINDPYINIDIGEVLGSQEISFDVATKLRERYREEEIERNKKQSKEKVLGLMADVNEELEDVSILIERNRTNETVK